MSGLSKDEAQIALDYMGYLNEIANYDASTRYVFGEVRVEKRPSVLVAHSNKLSHDLYCIWAGKTEYSDVRNRTMVA